MQFALKIPEFAYRYAEWIKDHKQRVANLAEHMTPKVNSAAEVLMYAEVLHASIKEALICVCKFPTRAGSTQVFL